MRNEADLSDEQFAIVAQFASGPCPPTIHGTDDEVDKIIIALAAVLKSPETSVNKGKLKLAVYRKALANLSLVALQAAANRAIQSLEWMPTPSELMRLAQGHEGEAQRLYGKASLMRRDRLQRIMDETLDAIERKEFPPDQLASLPPQTASIAETRGLITIKLDGTRLYRSRDTIREDQEERKRAVEDMKLDANEVFSRAQEEG